MLWGRSCWEAQAVLSQGQGTPRACPASIQQSTRQPLSSSKADGGGGTTSPPLQLLSSVTYFLGPNSRQQMAVAHGAMVHSWHMSFCTRPVGFCPL